MHRIGVHGKCSWLKPHAPGVFDLAWRGCNDTTEIPLLAQAGSDGSLYIHRRRNSPGSQRVASGPS
jgi:hypothetical protein